MTDVSRMLVLVSFASAVAITTAVAPAQTASPSPSPSPSAPSDPCGSILSIVTRPTVATAVCAVRPHHALLESGYTNSVTTGLGGGNAASYPQALIHVGTGDRRLEYELTPPSIVNANTGGAVTRGATDAGAGTAHGEPQPLHIEVHDGRRVEGQELAQQEPADDALRAGLGIEIACNHAAKLRFGHAKPRLRGREARSALQPERL